MAEQPANGRKVSDGVAALDALFEHRIRLGACVLLSSADALSFSRLKSLLAASDGNLGAQMRKLEDAGYIESRKEFQERRPVTWFALAPAGRTALRLHLRAMRKLLDCSGVKG